MGTQLEQRASTILVVEENRFLCEMICAWLQGAGYLTHGVHHEREVMTALAEGDFELVVIDLDVAQTNPISLVESVKSKLSGAGLVLLTGAVRYEDLPLSQAGTDTACVAMDKPYSFFALGLVIKAALARLRESKQHKSDQPCSCGCE